MSRKLIIVFLSIFTLVIILTVLFLPVFNQEEFIKSEFDTNSIFSSTEKPLVGGFTGRLEYRDNYKFVITNYDPFHPIYSLVTNIDAKPETNYISFQEIEQISLERSGINSFKIVARTDSKIRNKSFDEALELAQKYDLSQENPDPENITIYKPDPTPTPSPQPSPELTEDQKNELKDIYYNKLTDQQRADYDEIIENNRDRLDTYEENIDYFKEIGVIE